MASGVIEANRTGGTVKRMHCGWAAHSAIAAAQLVQHGFTGPPTVLEGRFGFFRAWLHGTFFPGEITDGLGEQWSVPGIFFKPYPANHFTHAGIDAARQLRVQGLELDDIESIELGVPRQNKPTVGEPIEVKRAPLTGYMAQFSGPYTVVAGLLGGGGLGVGLDDFTDELARDPRRRELMAKVSVVADDEVQCDLPGSVPGRAADPHRRRAGTRGGGVGQPRRAGATRCPSTNWPRSSATTRPVSWTTTLSTRCGRRLRRLDELDDVDPVLVPLRTIVTTQEVR